MINPLVSIITPCFNCSSFIELTVSSVIEQSYSSWELLLIDDFSTDDTYEKIKRLQDSDPRIKVVRNEKNLGVARTRNRGLQMASGELIAFLDSDDLWLDDKLEHQANIYLNQGSNFIISNYEFISEQGDPLRGYECPDEVSYLTLLKGSYIGCLTVLCSKSLIGETRFKEIYHEDYLMWLELLKKKEAKPAVIKKNLARYRLRANSLSANKLKCAYYQWRIYRIHLGFSLLRSVRLLISYASKGVLKHYAT